MIRRTAATLALGALLLPATAGAQAAQPRTLRISFAQVETGANGTSLNPAISGSGRITAYDSTASNLAEDPNGDTRDVFAFNSFTFTTRLVSQGLGEGGANGPSADPAISKTGNDIAFTSLASNLVPGDENETSDVFVAHVDGSVERVSVGLTGGDLDGPSYEPDISADGRFVVFTSAATDAVAGDLNEVPDVFVRDLKSGTTDRVSLSSVGEDGDGASRAPAISGDGRVVSFSSEATNLVKGDGNPRRDVFVRDLRRERTEIVSVSSLGRLQNRSVAPAFTQVSDLSRTGRYVAFDSDATNLVPGDTNRRTDVFVRDRRSKLTRLASENSGGFQGDNDSFAPTISVDGNVVAFPSFANNLGTKDPPGQDIYLHDIRRNSTTRVDVGAFGQQRGPERVRQLLQTPSLTSDGRLAAFVSSASNLVFGDDNARADVFLRVVRP